MISLPPNRHRRAPFDPRGLPGLSAWFDASDLSTVTYDGANAVSVWADKSFNAGRNLVQAVGAAQPLLVLAGPAGRPYLSSTANGQFLATAAISLPQPTTMYLVMRQNNHSNGASIWDGGSANFMRARQVTPSPNFGLLSNTSTTAINSTLEIGKWGAVAARYAGAGSSLAIDLFNPTTGNPGSITSDGLTIMASSGGIGSTRSDFAEILLYSANHDFAAQLAVKNYLFRKWALPA